MWDFKRTSIVEMLTSVHMLAKVNLSTGSAQNRRARICNLHCRAELFTVELDKHLSINCSQPVTRQGANTRMQIICISECVVWPASNASLGGFSFIK